MTEPLSDCEVRVARLTAQGLTAREIGPMLYVSPRTIEGYRADIIRKVGCPNTARGLLKWCIQNMSESAVIGLKTAV